MGARYTDYREVLVYGSGSAAVWMKGSGTIIGLSNGTGSIATYWNVAQSPSVSLQVMRTTTGSFTAIRFETSNFTDDTARAPFTSNAYWFEEQGPHSASLLTASAAPASVVYQVGNLNCRWLRAVVNVATGDVFRFQLHGKDGE